MLRSQVLMVVGLSSSLALLAYPAAAEDADVSQLKQELAALQKKLNVLEKTVEVNRAQEQTAIRSYETLTSGKDPGESLNKPFGIKFTFGGFVAAEGVYRDKNNETSIGTTYPKDPFDNVNQAHINELRGTAQQSRISLLAEGGISDHEKWTSYIEFDFLGAAPTANSNQSNSYTPRLRQFYGTYDDTRDGWHFLAGQSWSLVTLYKSGLIPRQENVPWTIDAQYVPGFDWLRNPEIRIVKDWDKKVWLGVEAASPQGLANGTFPGGNANGGVGTSVTFPCVSQLDPQANCALDGMPDFTAKLAVDPGWGHFEIFGLAREFRDRVTSGVAGNMAAANNSAWGFSGGGGMIVPIVGDKLQFQANVLYGQGVGRYGTDSLPDFTVLADGSVAPLTGYSIMAGLTSHNAIKGLDLYAYAGQDHVFNRFNDSVGFGNPVNLNNSGCDVLGSILCSSSQIDDVWQVTGGFWHSLYDGDKGKVAWGMQDSFTVVSTPEDAKGLVGKTNENVTMMSFRYYPKYGSLIGTKP